MGKYRIERRLADGPFAAVYRALDTIEGTRVALKVPRASLVDDAVLEDFRKEVRLTARLEHPHILPIKNADFVDGRFVVVLPLGEKTLGERLRSRLSTRTALDYTRQMLDAVGYAHRRGIIHCDIKPENFILFPENRLRLSDFGIAKVAQHTIRASGSGTVGYMAPEQAMGKPSLRSDVFSLGLILYRMFSGHLPEWPFEWPPPGHKALRRRVHPDFVELIRKAIQVDPRKRFADADRMWTAFQRIKPRVLGQIGAQRGRKKARTTNHHWQEVRRKQFQKEWGKLLETRYRCRRCAGPVSEPMQACPWCGDDRSVFPEETRFPDQCPRCRRGIKLDWRFCAWCYGPGWEPETNRQYSDRRYQARCSNPKCPRRQLMPFMRYCPWCRRKVRRKWTIPGSRDRCSSCGWGALKDYWSFCPWCTKSLGKR